MGCKVSLQPVVASTLVSTQYCLKKLGFTVLVIVDGGRRSRRHPLVDFIQLLGFREGCDLVCRRKSTENCCRDGKTVSIRYSIWIWQIFCTSTAFLRLTAAQYWWDAWWNLFIYLSKNCDTRLYTATNTSPHEVIQLDKTYAHLCIHLWGCTRYEWITLLISSHRDIRQNVSRQMHCSQFGVGKAKY
jgi:hypothetical protein